MSSKPRSAKLFVLDFKTTDFPPQLTSLKCKVASKRPSDNPSLRGGRRVDVLEESADDALTKTNRADVIVKAGGYTLADVGIDGECRTVV